MGRVTTSRDAVCAFAAMARSYEAIIVSSMAGRRVIRINSCLDDIVLGRGTQLTERGISILLNTAGDHVADLDGDGVVGAADLAVLLGQWRRCPFRRIVRRI